MSLLKLIESLNSNKSEVFDFERDHRQAMGKTTYKGEKPKKALHPKQ